MGNIMVKRAEILELIQETIAECEEAIKARPSSKREFEISLVSSGMEIVQVETDEQALLWA
jgi:hypothetical protein